MAKYFEELDYQQTPLGELTLSCRRTPMLPGQEIFEIKLNGEFLMSSLFFGSEVALATLGLGAATDFDALDVVVGGLGLGFTAVTVLDDPRVKSLIVVDYLQAVIGWHQAEKVPLGARLNRDSRCRLQHGDFFELAKGVPLGLDPSSPGRLFHAILLDIDHSPKHFLNESHQSFYEEPGLQALARQLHPGGVFALWSNDAPDEEFMNKLRTVFSACQSHVVSFPNPIQNGESRCTVYVASKA